MANSYTTQIFEDGGQNTVVKVDFVLDTSDLSSQTVLDPAAQYIDPVTPTTQYRIDQMDWQISDPIVLRLLWDATTPKRIEELSGRGHLSIGDLYGGLQNDAGAGKNGKITCLTTGYTSGTVAGTLILHGTKQ
jgi:hypothetical protein